MQKDTMLRLLYIPIWLYSNSFNFYPLKSLNYFTFQSGYIPTSHSTCAVINHFSLYIPIWLYSNHYSAYKTVYHFYYLYIPIWLYSNENNADFINCIAFFTFQSGYIPTKCHYPRHDTVRPLHSNLVIFQLPCVTMPLPFFFYFTFQSGYIPTGQ